MAKAMDGQIQDVMKNINAELEKIKGRSMKGMIRAVIWLRRDMEYTPPLIPVDTGNLRSSWFTKQFYVRNAPVLMFGFSASYAAWVHENMGAGDKTINWKRPGAGPKFLQAALARNERDILRIIAENATI